MFCRLVIDLTLASIAINRLELTFVTFLKNHELAGKKRATFVIKEMAMTILIVQASMITPIKKIKLLNTLL